MSSYDRVIHKNIYLFHIKAVVYRMTLASLQLFLENLDNFQAFFGQVVQTPPPPREKIAHTSMKGLNITDNSVVINKLRQDKSGQALRCSRERFCGL